MKKFFFLLLILTFYGCEKIEDDTGLDCFSDCTTLHGRFVTMDNEGIPDVKVSVHYIIRGTNSRYIRKLAQTTTDQNGTFYKEFYIKDEEIGESAQGYFKIITEYGNLDVNKYIISQNSTNNSEPPSDYEIFRANTRDTIIGGNYYLPKRAYLKVNLNNFLPQEEHDYFQVMSIYPYGAVLDSEYSTKIRVFSTKETDATLNVIVAENEENIIRVMRRKNGVDSVEEFPLFVPSNNTIELTYDY